MFTDIIESLLQKKANLAVEKERRMQEALEAVELEFADTATKIDGMLNMAGYVEPVVEETPVDEVVDETVDGSENLVDETVDETVNERVEAVSGETFYNI